MNSLRNLAAQARLPHARKTRRRALFAIPLLGVLALALLWAVIVMRLSVEKESAYREAAASAAILSTALEQHTIKAIHQVDQITRFVKFEFEKSPDHFNLASTVEKGVVPSDTLIQVSLVNAQGQLLANTAETHPKPLDLSDREHFQVHASHNDDELYISRPVLGRVSGQWTLQMTRRLNGPDGKFAGVVVVSEDPSYFTSDFYNNAAIGKEGVIAVVSDTGAVLARRTGSAGNAAGTFSATGVYPIAERVSGTYADPIDGTLRIVSYRHLDGYPLGVLVGLSQAEELADYNHTRNVYLLMTSFITLAMLAFFGVATGLIGKLLGREREMTQLAEYDLLTGLANRYTTLRGLRNDVAQPSSLKRLAILFIDLDNFKTVNDTLGHNAGDIVLQMTAARLSDAVEAEGTLARIGGDEFVVVVKGDDAERRAVRLAESVIRMFGKPFDVRGSTFVLHASIGIALHSVANESEIDLLKKADLAMYSAKDAGKNCYQFYAPHLSHRADHLMRWEQQLRIALSEGQLFLAFQPKIDLTQRCITGFEALVRWEHPEHGLIAANEFITIAESTGLIVPIGDYVIRTACRQLARWREEGHDTLTLAVNISPVQFWRGDLIETISQAIDESGIQANRLEIEITETAMMEYPELVSDKIMALKKLGIRIALDDFGTGYSSLSYLHRFAVDTLKVDRSFVQAIPADRSVCVMVSSIVHLARALGLTVVVEGTETEEQVAWLSALGQIQAQGFLFSRPVPVDGIPALLARFGVCGTRETAPRAIANFENEPGNPGGD
ncbi:bifunctional diguanylate cyclase/phosphodiesterase [Burkholderia gladioli]|uniref:bifunctional diguanylate cyclase/phosphodiesterase n=1 Tax=Burkholderia gladioli TaxID=28095 RepID=UPI00264FBBEB|nr:EAL domain-containing protein [Burkholderia gladioli]MDN7719547.1 EAL domain-containing protein [Burkholderia gladioli]